MSKQSKIIDEILAAKLTGVIGTASQLYSVNKRYEYAIKTVLGKKANSVLVEKKENIVAALKFVKSKRLGIAEFYALDSLYPDCFNDEAVNEKAVIDFAINVLCFKKEYRAFFECLLGNTLIIKDIRSAINLIGKYKMVTLEGDLIELDGSISGGIRRF